MNLKEKGFQLPENVYFDSESLTDTYGKFYAEAFERGIGTTIGNALRRVLLSSIEGTAVASIRIPGVLHEFSTLPGVKEDVVDIVLNIKQLRFKLHSNTPKVVSINVKGPAEVKGKDITTDARVDVLTPQQHIATLEKKANLKMELTVKKGRGYVTADNNKEADQPVDVIAVDSIFTPIKKVNFWVEGARVGRSTDYDRLVMEIWTDGSIRPQNALTQASNILREYISLFSLGKEEEVVDKEEDKEKDEKKIVVGVEYPDNDPLVFNENLLRSVDELELSVRAHNCLRSASIQTIADLVQRTEQEMLRTKNFGRKSLNEIKKIILAMGLRFNMRVDLDILQEMAEAKGK